MLHSLSHLMMTALKRWLKTGALVILLTVSLLGISTISWNRSAAADPVLISALPGGNAITDGKALLRYALPIDNEAIRDIQKSIEETSESLRTRKRFGAINGNLKRARRILDSKQTEILGSVAQERKPEAEAIVAQLQSGLDDMQMGVEEKDREKLWLKRGELLDLVGQLEELMVSQFPFEVPAEYSNLPQLKGRATVEFVTSKGTMKAVVDGYSAPVTAGNFIDLVQRGFYDGLEFTRAEDFYVVQVGDPPGADEGFIDPKTGKYRSIPIEVLVEGDTEPTYGVTLEESGRYLDQPVLPFSAYGTLGMARPGDDPNGGSSQFFFFLFEAELTPAGRNLLDGRYSVFGYVTENKEVLGQLKQGDRIETARVIDGAENLVQPTPIT
ncbi:peptidylprolyl isomerase [Oculatella sp. LEGE 06141]|uniref:peptidylprolyl isomerase n=1 Tax=Oculatella sp. LEGE 06141 TaxID=1828648 RepID=UPI0018808B20|nr:peptidylprolyl isomerase [Oculatella sp. LEGE 06141]MBE9178209.1 peptidylprolyl isomerase [Oculatella sp. LEGE 06141]